MRPRQPSTAPRLSCLGRGFGRCPERLRGSILFSWSGLAVSSTGHYRRVVSLLGGIGDLDPVDHVVVRPDKLRRRRHTRDEPGRNEDDGQARGSDDEAGRGGPASEHGRLPGFLWKIGDRDPLRIRSHSRAGGGASPRAASRGPPGSTLTDNRSALLPLSGLSPTLPSPRAPSAWPLDRGRAAPPLLHPLGPLLRFHARHLEINDPACQAPGTLGPQYPLGSKLAHWLSPSTGLCDAAIFACLAVALAAGVGLLFASNFPGSHSPFVHFWVGPLIIPALHPNSPSAPVLSAGFRVEDFCPLPTPPDWTYAMETTSS